MLKIEPYFFEKQQIVIDWFFNHTTTDINEFLYGGAAGGGKTRVGVSSILLASILYPKSRWVIGRARLNILKQTTMVTFFEVCNDWGLKRDFHYKYNEQKNEVTIIGSESVIILKDLFAYPSDPDFDSLGSLEICGAFVDEVPQVVQRAISVLGSRMRYNLTKWCECGALNEKNEVIEHDANGEPSKWKCKTCGEVNEGLRPKLLMGCNPTRGWVFTHFYDKWRKGTIEKYRFFLPAKVTDNPKISKHYREQLRRLPKLDRERLELGNWEYSDITALFDFQKVQEFLISSRPKQYERCVMSVDVARLGKDKTVIMVMNEQKTILLVEEIQGARTNEVAKRIKKIAEQFDIDEYDIAIDTDGVGGGVSDHFDNVYEIINNSRAINGENYENLKTQLYCTLAEEINSEKLTCAKGVFDDSQAELLVQELEAVKRAKIDRDGKVAITPKAEIKQMLQRSPDYADALAYLMVFVVEESFNDGYESF